jgi:hypothetical protein
MREGKLTCAAQRTSGPSLSGRDGKLADKVGRDVFGEHEAKSIISIHLYSKYNVRSIVTVLSGVFIGKISVRGTYVSPEGKPCDRIDIAGTRLLTSCNASQGQKNRRRDEFGKEHFLFDSLA